MYNTSRIDIYNYVFDLLYDGDVVKNVYPMFEPQELTESDVADGFVVIRVGDVVDESEFQEEAFARCRVYIEAFIPTKTRGRLDSEKFDSYEKAINAAVKKAVKEDGEYCVLEDSVLSSDVEEESNANNFFHVFIKSFVVLIDQH